MRELDPQVPFYNVSRSSDHTKAATFQQKLAGDLLVVFGVLALALAGIGSYGVLSYLVGLRRREIGIRLAVGATRADVFRLIAGSGAQADRRRTRSSACCSRSASAWASRAC